MQISRVSFRGEVLDFSKARQSRQNQGIKMQALTRQDTFRKSNPEEADVKATKRSQEPEEQTITENSPIYYIRIFDRLDRNLSSNNKAYRITPEEAAREVIKILKEGKAIKALKTAYNNKRYAEVDDFLSSYQEIDNSLHDSNLNENTYLAIKALAIPIKALADEFDERDDIEIPEDSVSLRDCETGNYLLLENIVKIEQEGTEAEKAKNWESIIDTINKAHTIEEFPVFNFSIPSSPNFDSKIWIKTLEKLANIIAQARQKFPCNPQNYIPEDAENDYEEE